VTDLEAAHVKFSEPACRPEAARTMTSRAPIDNAAVDQACRDTHGLDAHRRLDLHRQVDLVQIDVQHVPLGGMVLDLLDHRVACGLLTFGPLAALPKSSSSTTLCRGQCRLQIFQAHRESGAASPLP